MTMWIVRIVMPYDDELGIGDAHHLHVFKGYLSHELISDRNDYRRNEQVTKALKSKYGLTYGTDKSNTNTRKLRNAERANYQRLSRHP